MEALIHQRMRERGLTFKQALNQAVRAGLALANVPESYSTPTYSMGFRPQVGLDQALTLAAALEDEALREKISRRK